MTTRYEETGLNAQRRTASSLTRSVRRSWLSFGFAKRGFSTCLTTLCASALLISATAHADDQPGADLRWFEVEVLVFKQDPQRHADEEYFPLQIRPVPLQNHLDLLNDYRRDQLAPALEIIPTCTEDDENHWFEVVQRLRILSEPAFITGQRQKMSLCRDSIEEALITGAFGISGAAGSPRAEIREVAAQQINGEGGDIYSTESPFLMPTESFELNSLRQQLERQRGKSTLLHTSWRQPVYSRNQGRKIRLFGGQNYTSEYDYLGFAHDFDRVVADRSDNPNYLLQQQNAPLERIQSLLNLIEQGQTPFSRPDRQTAGLPERPANPSANLPQDVWEFDGLMHIYLVGNYLHIDGEFNLREEVQVPLQATSLEAQANAALRQEEAAASFLRGYYFNQLRRVISHETHYFDHPNFGILVQIRRTDLSSRR
ncbi:hypothetical protein CWE12_00185 [Aliidiomarina sedimenti]|uniref:Uncharacterized protein n=1 Tax=Aliidiomarina sedimenti TaxID=1933879 RepID=A0ABY0C1C6_9GAMM|nr:hypothetical protein CWE12_00185 [Aliidiomarina sedimenti]